MIFTRMAHTVVLPLPVFVLTSHILILPHSGKRCGETCSACPDHAQGKKVTLVGIYVGITGRKGNTWKSLNLNQRKNAPRVVASKKYG